MIDEQTQTQGDSTVSPEVEKVISAVVLASEGLDHEAELVAATVTGEANLQALAAGIAATDTVTADLLVGLGETEAQVRARIRSDKRRRRLEEHRRAASLTVAQPPPSDALERAVKHAGRHMAAARALRSALGRKRNDAVRAQIKDHETQARMLTKQAREMAQGESDAHWLEHAMQETEQLATARGESVAEQTFTAAEFVVDENGARMFTDEDLPVVRFTKGKRKVISNRGRGLEDARDKGYLEPEHGPDRSDDLYRVGVRYREAFEIARGETTSRGEGGGGFGPKGPQLRIIEAGQELATMRRDLTKRQAEVLDLVCGQGLGLNQAAEKLHAGLLAVRRSLRGGLTEALRSLKERSKAPEGYVDLFDQVKAAAEAVQRAGRGL